MPNSLDRDREDLALAVGRAMPLAREDGGDLIVIHAGTREGEHAIAHFLSTCELGDSVEPPLDLKLGHSPAAPNDPDRGDVVFAAVEHDLVDEASQQSHHHSRSFTIRCQFIAKSFRSSAAHFRR
jgi:hypothetical protein